MPNFGEWQPESTAPFNIPALACVRIGTMRGVVVAWKTAQRGWETLSHVGCYPLPDDCVRLWMPLPEPPKDEPLALKEVQDGR